MRRSKTLPPLESLRVFHEVARQEGFRKAGDTLLISQSAVSHHIRKLEDVLGRPLFQRHSKSISLTEAGQEMLEATQAGFDLIAEATARLRQSVETAPLRISLLPSFATNWLLPRIDRFRARHSNIEVQLDPTLALADLAQGDADLAIRYGSRPQVPHCRRLFTEALCPAVSADYPARMSIRTPSDVLAYPLLDSQGSHDWRIWLEANGLDPSRGQFMQLRDYNVVLEAIASGLGIGMARKRLTSNQIASGRIKLCFEQSVIVEEAAHWLISRGDQAQHPSTKTFIKWLVAECADTN